MTVEQIKDTLIAKPSFFKESYRTISDRFGISLDGIYEAFEIYPELRAAKRDYNSKRPQQIGYNQNSSLLSKINSLEREVARLKGETIAVKLPKRKLPLPYEGGDPKTTLVISDLHLPFERKGYLEFCREQQEKYNAGRVVQIGDEVDLCAISQWEKDPDGLSAGSEYQLALEKLQEWFSVFPQVFVTIGNHTARPFRLARTLGLSHNFIKSYEQIWNAPAGWKWAENWEFDGVLYTHGTGLSGPNAAISKATMLRQNICMGHIHTEAGVKYSASSKDLVWGMQVGGAVDDKAYAFAYARDYIKKSIVGCGIVLESKIPIFIPMPL